jgi:hypothetical protein
MSLSTESGTLPATSCPGLPSSPSPLPEASNFSPGKAQLRMTPLLSHLPLPLPPAQLLALVLPRTRLPHRSCLSWTLCSLLSASISSSGCLRPSLEPASHRKFSSTTQVVRHLRSRLSRSSPCLRLKSLRFPRTGFLYLLLLLTAAAFL